MRYFVLICFLSVILSACRNEPVRREYQEVTARPAGMRADLPEGHPSVSALPEEHPSIDGLPEGHPPINGLPEGHPPVDNLPDGHPPVGGDMNDPSMRAMIQGSVSDAPIVWTSPQGWTELPGDGMRIATFKSSDGSVNMTLTSFGGQAGGVEGNVVRWLNQLNINLQPQALEGFIAGASSFQSSGSLPVKVFDFTGVAPDQSMLAAIVEIPDSTVFVKATGSAENLKKQKDAFVKFCESLRINQ